jgi:hypothetical protein
VKSAKEVAKKKEQSLIATADGKPTPEETKAIEAPHPGDDHASGMETAESGKNKKNKKKFCADDAVEMVSKHASHTQDPPVMDETPNKQESNNKKSKKASRELDGSVHNVEPLSDKNVDAVEGDKVAKAKKSRKAKAL